MLWRVTPWDLFKDWMICWGDRLQISDMNSWGKRKCLCWKQRNQGRNKLWVRRTPSVCGPRKGKQEAQEFRVCHYYLGEWCIFQTSHPAYLVSSPQGLRMVPEEMYFSLSPLTMSTENIRMLACQSEMIFNWLLLFIFQIHRSVEFSNTTDQQRTDREPGKKWVSRVNSCLWPDRRKFWHGEWKVLCNWGWHLETQNWKHGFISDSDLRLELASKNDPMEK